MFWEELPWVIGLFVAVVVTAALVNRVRLQNRPRLRRMVVLYALYVVAIGAALAFEAIDRPTWADSSALATAALTIGNTGGAPLTISSVGFLSPDGSPPPVLLTTTLQIGATFGANSSQVSRCRSPRTLRRRRPRSRSS